MHPWKLNDIPAYSGGTLLETLYDCGSGLAVDDAGPTPEDTQMHIIRDTDETAFSAYCALLAESGFACLFSRDEDYGLFRQYQNAATLVYTYYSPAEQTVRVLSDKCSASLPDFAHAPQKPRHMDTQFMQFGLLYDDMIRWTSCDCGMNYVLRLRDGRLIVIDGGECEQATQTALGEFMKRVRAMTQTNEGDPVRIALWYCTHPHDDHMDFFTKLLEKYGGMIELERVMFNFASDSVLGLNDYVQQMRRTVVRHSPDAQFLKVHTGMDFSIGGARFDVLFTHEDLLALESEEPDYDGTNTTSTVLRLSFEDVSVLFLADADDTVGDVLNRRFPQGLSCTFVQAAHHLINRVEHIYRMIRAERVLIPECRYLIHKNLRRNYAVLCRYYDRDEFYLAGDYTCVFHVCGSEIEEKYYPVRGCLYDGT